jgi:DNA polymerase-3 subunit epsilon
MRQVVLDVETTGLEWKLGHRVIEVGCVELIGRRSTKNYFHSLVNPERLSDDGALEVHGISNDSLQGQPKFGEIAQDLLNFITGSELVIHNAEFDTGFLNNEFSLVGKEFGKIEDHCLVQDTLQLARKLHPGQRNSLDALCKRYGIDNSHRALHGALLDAEILVEVYLAMTGGQTQLLFGDKGKQDKSLDSVEPSIEHFAGQRELTVIRPNSKELKLHQAWLDLLGEGRVWPKEK